MANVTVSPEMLSQMIAQAVQAALANAKLDRKDAAIAAAKDGKSERSIKNEILAARAFKKAGFGEVKPHEDVKTYNRWIAAGFKVKPGEKSVKVKNLRLFHRSQVVEITSDEKAAEVAKMQEAIRNYNNKKKGVVEQVNA